MKKSDVIVIGGGLAGLFAAAVAAQKGKKVTVLSYGAGALTIGGGVIDMMGYAEGNKPFATPIEGVKNAPADHPYARIGEDAVKASVKAFMDMAKAEGYAYEGSLDAMKWIPTAVGTLKPTALTSRTMDTAKMESAKKLVVVDIEGLKDFSAALVAKNIQTVFPNKTIETVRVAGITKAGRDMTAIDVARELEHADVRARLISALKGKAAKDVCFLIAPVLGSHASYNVFDAIAKELGSIVECAAVAPSVTGIRLRELMLGVLRKLGVTLIEKAHVCGSVAEGGKVVAVTTKDFGRQRAYRADEFILASGGFYGGGFTADQENVTEVVFNLPIVAPATVEEWTNAKMFSDQKQPFAMIGLATNDQLQPIDAAGKVIYPNVRVIGRSMAGYDFCFEKSGNGVAIASAYKAASLIAKGGKSHE